MSGTRFGRVSLYVAVVILATWAVHWLTTVPGESADTPGIPVGMLVPALVAILFRFAFAAESPIHHRRIEGPARLLLFSHVGLFAACLVVQIIASHAQSGQAVLVGIGNVLMILWTLLLIRMLQGGKGDSLSRHGISLGNVDVGVIFVVGYVLFFLLQFGLNLLLDLGDFRGMRPLPMNLSLPGFAYGIAVFLLFLLAVVGTPLASMAVMFGEEYGWRGFLQDELAPAGRRLAALIIGVIWWFWHLPIILSGIHTYPPTALGFGMALLFFVLWGFVQSYAVLKTGSILAAAFLHGVVNSVYSFGLTYFVRPENKLMAFGLGWPGLAFLAVVVLIVLTDPVWGRTSTNAGRP